MDISAGDSCPPTTLTILSHVGSRTLFSVCLQQLSQTHAHPYVFKNIKLQTILNNSIKCLRARLRKNKYKDVREMPTQCLRAPTPPR